MTHIRFENGPWLRTATGRDFFFADPFAIGLLDIAASLAKINRFNGHTRAPYSVAQHSVWVARRLQEAGHSPHTQLAGLLHDAPEAYLGDMATPVQAHIFGPDRGRNILPSAWESAHGDLEAAVHAALGLTVTHAMRAAVKQADLMALRTEWRDLMPGDEPAEFRDLPVPHGEKVLPFDNWLTAQEVFLARYNIIMRDMALGGASGVSA